MIKKQSDIRARMGGTIHTTVPRSAWLATRSIFRLLHILKALDVVHAGELLDDWSANVPDYTRRYLPNK